MADASKAFAAMTETVVVGEGCAVGVFAMMISVGVTVGVLVDVSVGVTVGVLVDISVGVSVGVSDGDGVSVLVTVDVVVAVFVGRGVRVKVRVGLGDGVTGIFSAMESLAVAVRPFASRYLTYTVCVPALDGKVQFTCTAYGCHLLPAKSAELEICTSVGCPMLFDPSPPGEACSSPNVSVTATVRVSAEPSLIKNGSTLGCAPKSRI